VDDQVLTLSSILFAQTSLFYIKKMYKKIWWEIIPGYNI
jgi:hypothetical protein